MITEKDLQEAIMECQGQKNPTANTCIKLAAYYTILENITKETKSEKQPDTGGYSYDLPKRYSSNSDFGKICAELDSERVMWVMDELMETLRVMNPRLYDAVMRKLTTLD